MSDRSAKATVEVNMKVREALNDLARHGRFARGHTRQAPGMKFRKKPTIIEAIQFSNAPADDPHGVFRRPEDNSPYVVTIHDQRCYLSPGDWIIPEPDGIHYYPCKPDIFKATYEPVTEGTP